MMGSAVWVPRLWLALCNLAVPPITSRCAATTFLSQFWTNPQILRDESTSFKIPAVTMCVFLFSFIPSGVPHVKNWRTPVDGTDRLCWPSLPFSPPIPTRSLRPHCVLWMIEAMPVVSASTGTAKHMLKLLVYSLWWCLIYVLINNAGDYSNLLYMALTLEFEKRFSGVFCICCLQLSSNHHPSLFGCTYTTNWHR